MHPLEFGPTDIVCVMVVGPVTLIETSCEPGAGVVTGGVAAASGEIDAPFVVAEMGGTAAFAGA